MVLIIDDENAVRQAISLVVSRMGYTPVEAADSPSALSAVRDERVRLAVVDMNLTLSTTGRDGIELLRKIKVLRPDLPVILLTAWGTIPLAVEGMNYGAADFMTKPWSNEDLRRKIRRLIERSERDRADAERVAPLESLERDAIIRAIRLSNGNLSLAAQRLGITRQALYRRIEKYGL